MTTQFKEKYVGWIGSGVGALVAVIASKPLGLILGIGLGVIVGFAALQLAGWAFLRWKSSP